jgi:hypothetical protein
MDHSPVTSAVAPSGSSISATYSPSRPAFFGNSASTSPASATGTSAVRPSGPTGRLRPASSVIGGTKHSGVRRTIGDHASTGGAIGKRVSCW